MEVSLKTAAKVSDMLGECSVDFIGLIVTRGGGTETSPFRRS